MYGGLLINGTTLTIKQQIGFFLIGRGDLYTVARGRKPLKRYG
jgi:hypothetical protein